MPEISVGAAERHISKIRTTDFFANIFTSATNTEDPSETIENLEIILDPQIDEYDIDEDGLKIVQEMTKVLEQVNVQFKLSLWQKLRAVRSGKMFPRVFLLTNPFLVLSSHW